MKSCQHNGYTIQQVINHNPHLFWDMSEKQQCMQKIWMIKNSKYSEVWYTMTLQAAKKLCL